MWVCTRIYEIITKQARPPKPWIPAQTICLKTGNRKSDCWHPAFLVDKTEWREKVDNATWHTRLGMRQPDTAWLRFLNFTSIYVELRTSLPAGLNMSQLTMESTTIINQKQPQKKKKMFLSELFQIQSDILMIQHKPRMQWGCWHGCELKEWMESADDEVCPRYYPAYSPITSAFLERIQRIGDNLIYILYRKKVSILLQKHFIKKVIFSAKNILNKFGKWLFMDSKWAEYSML